MSAPVVLVLAMSDNGVIGDRGGLPWRIPDDMKRFKRLTFGKPVIMGRKTWDSLPRRPLPGRTNIVVTRDRSWQAEGALAAHSLDEALTKARGENPSEIAVIGGAEIYKVALPLADRIELTQVHIAVDGDTHLPLFDKSAWREDAREDHTTEDGLSFSYVRLQRI
jgi:dihydrofolate reductase